MSRFLLQVGNYASQGVLAYMACPVAWHELLHLIMQAMRNVYCKISRGSGRGNSFPARSPEAQDQMSRQAQRFTVCLSLMPCLQVY